MYNNYSNVGGAFRAILVAQACRETSWALLDVLLVLEPPDSKLGSKIVPETS